MRAENVSLVVILILGLIAFVLLTTGEVSLDAIYIGVMVLMGAHTIVNAIERRRR